MSQSLSKSGSWLALGVLNMSINPNWNIRLRKLPMKKKTFRRVRSNCSRRKLSSLDLRRESPASA
ncbi:hypothetical protein VZQ01_36615 [Myxococcus faecalis]|uniref:hypothetical protein n=1 Tax=Myxococcus TaxID=32 RepID=UPI001CBBE963|nr:hypothetical protein [Myxococcus sp. XM-1-1-1]MBZ4409345.1 hypothetical protein [Myxococcus sp. XM-1-1-1]